MAPIAPETILRDIFNTIVFSFNVLASLLLLDNSHNFRARILRWMGVVLILVLAINPFGDFQLIERILSIVFTIFFISISINVYRDIYKAKNIDIEMISAVFCGFILLGLLSSFIFRIIEVSFPGSFSGLSTDSGNFDDLTYFSFITLLTIGYGDIAPQTNLSRTITVIVGLLGHFYTVIVTGIVIGKYLVRYNPNE